MSITSKIEAVRQSIESLKEFALSGDIQPHEALAAIKESDIKDFLSSEILEIQREAFDVLQHNFVEQGKKSYKDGLYQYTLRGGSTRYYFTDVEEVKNKKSAYESSEDYKSFKEAQSKYKTAFLQKQKGLAMFDEDTGEEIDVSKVNVVYNPNTVSVKRLG